MSCFCKLIGDACNIGPNNGQITYNPRCSVRTDCYLHQQSTSKNHTCACFATMWHAYKPDPWAAKEKVQFSWLSAAWVTIKLTLHSVSSTTSSTYVNCPAVGWAAMPHQAGIDRWTNPIDWSPGQNWHKHPVLFLSPRRSISLCWRNFQYRFSGKKIGPERCKRQ